MHCNIRTVSGALAVVFALHATPSLAEPKIGNASATKNQVEGVVGGSPQTLSNGSEVYSNEVIRTQADSVADLRFLDKTSLVVGPISEVRLDKFIYDPSSSSGSVVINVSKGAFRFVAGSQDKKSYEIRTPYGTLGVRG
jgi:hypothetical protein